MRHRCFTAFFSVLVLAALSLVSFAASAQQVPITRYARYTGNVNFVATGGSLRTEANTGNACAVGTTSSQALTGIPVGATIAAAYLYWGGSGTTVDSSVTLNGNTIAASRTFQATFTNGGTNYPYFGGFADVTSRVTGNATLTFSGLAVSNGSPWCDSEAVLAGWGLIVVYSLPTEKLRAINVYDGLQFFRGSSLTLTPDGFRTPASGIDGRVAVITWEGDPGNSDPLNGFSESLRFNGTTLDDGLVPAGSDPTIQQYDGTVSSVGSVTSYGADIDTYNVTSLLGAGQTSATTLYSAGNDLVLLTAQVVSVTSEPVVDLSLTKTHTGNFTVGTNASYTLTVSNLVGSQRTDFPITVTDTLPTGLTYVSATGTGWTCGAVGQVVTCTTPGPINAGASAPAITLNVAVGNAAFPSIANSATASTPSYDPDTASNSATDTASVLGPVLTTSTKSVLDLNGGDANPGDTLRYTITVSESAGIAATGVSVTDNVPANVANFTISSFPTGAVNASTGTGTGSNGTGFVNVTGISVPANSSVTVVFDVRVAAGTTPGATIDNTATVNNPAGTTATPSAPQLIVSQSQIPGSGTKPLYLYSDATLSRTPPTSAQAASGIDEGATNTWIITPALATSVTLAAGAFSVPLWMSETGDGTTRTIQVTLRTSTTVISSVSFTTTMGAAAALSTVTLPLAAQVTVPANETLRLVITNNSTGSSNRRVLVHPFPSAGNFSRVNLNSLSVINVNSVLTYNAAYAGGTATTTFSRGGTAYVRAVVSDPFGSFDIAGANLSILDPSATTIISNVAMPQVADSGAATRTYEYAFAVPGTAPAGTWTARIVAREGTEGTVTDLGVGTFSIALPTLAVQKISEVLSDPHNNATNPKRIPGSVQRYTITVTNSGGGTVDSNSLVLSDPLPVNLSLYVSTSGGPPVEFIDGSIASGLAFSYATQVTYSNQPGGGPPHTYTPVPDATGYDAAVTGVRIAPSGTMNGANGANTPSFSVRLRAKVK